MIDERLPGPTTTSRSSPTGRSRIPRTTSARSRRRFPQLLAETGVDPADVDRHRHRLHRVHDAADDRRRHAALPARASSAASRTPGSSCGSTTPPSRRPTASTRSPPSAASRGSRATAARSRPSGSSPRRCRSSTRRPRSTRAADRLIEAADWVVWQLTGVETRNTCTAGYKAIWSKRDGFPTDAYFAALDPRFEHVVDEKMSRQISPIGERAGGLSERGRGLDRPAARARPSRWPTSTRTSPRPRRP